MIHELIALHGHVVDDRDWGRLDEVFADDVVFDVADYGYGTLYGLQAMQDLVRVAGMTRISRWGITSPV